jgi:hypothetical protein
MLPGSGLLCRKTQTLEFAAVVNMQTPAAPLPAAPSKQFSSRQLSFEFRTPITSPRNSSATDTDSSNTSVVVG